MQLISQFLFLHPNYKRLVEFAAETTMANYIKYFRQNIFKHRLNEEIKVDAAEQQGKEYDSNEVEVRNFYKKHFFIIDLLNYHLLIDLNNWVFCAHLVPYTKLKTKFFQLRLQ